MIGTGRLASPPRCHQHLVEWNDTQTWFPEESRLHDLVAAQARRTPDTIAISVLDGPALSFRELVQRSCRLASRLRRLGVGPEKRVGIHLKRSPEMIIALLGTLFAGGAFVPLGPSLPARRLRFMLGDARPRVIVTTRCLSDEAQEQDPSSSGTRLLCLDEIDAPGDLETPNDASPRVDADHPAYVLFTSGSTGRPKAVVIPHRAVCNHRHWMQAELPLDGTDRLLQTAALNFDGSVWEIFAPLIAGAQLILTDDAGLGDPAELVEVLSRARVSVSRVVASLLRPLLDQSALRQCRDLRRLVSVGEALATELKDRALATLPKCALYNLYGPSEATIHASGALCRRPARHHEPLATASIGRPVANVKCHVLDEMQRVVGGDAGALYIGGVGLARGYLGRPGLSAERFVPDPYGLPGQRLYATGDRVRRLADGSLTFLGRLDLQVKIRGYRVELGEIERALGDHPDVAEAAVRLTAEERLVAYAVAHRSSAARLADAWRDEHVEQWRAIYDSTYETPDAEADQAGWDSSYTGRSLSAEHIADSVDHTVERLLRLRLRPGDGDPRRMLEIGCGTGLLLFRLAPSCDRFLATDLSPTVVAAVRSRLKEPAHRLPQVEVRARPAHEFAGIEEGSFDVVFCNSVVGHFPSADYLLEVIEGMVRATAPGGSVFVGDVRNLALEEALATSIEAFKASPDLPLTELREQVRRHLRQEDRLAVDPAFFVALPGRLPRITSVRIWPKGGRLLNELTRFRFDVVLELDGGSDEERPEVEITRADWQEDVLGLHRDSLTASGLKALMQYLEAERPPAVVISNVPNARAGWAASLLVRSRTDDGTVGELGPVIPESVRPAREGEGAIDLSELQAMLAGSGYRGELSWARCDATGDFELAVWRSDLSRPVNLDAVLRPPVEEPESWSGLTNDPLSRQLHRRQVLDWRAHLEDRLPDYMVPSAYVLLDAMPRTPSGKLDRRALPGPETDRPDLSSEFVAPRSADEKRLAKIWSQVLGVDGIGVHDNFFELGGHSLLATRVAARTRDSFGLELPLRCLFDSPTLAELAVYLARARRASPDVGRRMGQTIGRVSRPADLPLSFAQQRLWFLHQLHPESPAYNSPRGFRLLGPLDTLALEAALGEMCRRHESLRTRFPSVAGQPRQAIVEASRVELPMVDLQACGESDEQQERLALRLIHREVVRPFDLTQGPLMRALLVRLGIDHHLFLLNLHHIVTDSWSEEILYQEIATLYAAWRAGRPSSLAKLPIQYADFALWQHSWLSGERLEQLLSYWRRQLRELSPQEFPPQKFPPQEFPPQDLPAQRGTRRPEAAADAGAVMEFQWPSRLNEALDALSLRAGTSPFITLLTAFMALLYRTTGQRDLAVGSPVANRGWGELEGLIGFFVNMLVMRARVSGELRFRELLKEVRDVTLGAYDHQDLPFEKLVEELQPRRESFENPFFQVAFALHNVARSELDLPDLQVDSLTLDSGAVRFALEVHLWPADRGLADRALVDHGLVDRGITGCCVYRADLLENTAVARLIAHLENLLAAAMARPDSRIEELPLLTHAQLQQQIVEWNDSWAKAPESPSVDRAFEAQAMRRPDALAVTVQDEHLSYRELDRRSDRLADELRALGLELEQRVGLCVEPSVEMVVGLLAILRAGGAYLPLDPSHPRRRLRLMLRDADASLLLIRGALIPGVLGEAQASPPRRTTFAADLEIISLGCKSEPGDVLLSGRPEADNLACVLYTSGSTGRPKGIGLTHRSLIGLALATDPLRLRPANRVAQLSNLSFDAATFEIWGTLLQGAPLVILPEERPLAPERLAVEVQRQRIDTLFLTTALLNVVLRERPDAVRGLKHLLFGGEAAEPRWVDVARAEGPEQLLNFYGPAENTTFASYYQVNEPLRGAPVPIGSSVLQTQLYVLKDLKALPMGSAGELHIAGAGLARGYLGQAERTARRFRPDPFGCPGTRLYRTGDLVRQRSDGLLEFLGRVDHQVKIRGFRVEPSEVEAVLKRHVSVREAVVHALLATNGHHGQRLVAYVVPADASEVERSPVTRWRSYLGRHLPTYMVPSVFVTVDDLPLTPSGKVDREALPTPDDSRLDREAEYQAPRTSLEATMAKIWSSLLGFERIGVRDNFFELGGHSLLAIQVVSRAREEIGGELPLRWLFDHPTVADLCRVLEERDPESGRPDRLSVTVEDVLPSAIPGRMEEGRI